MLHVVTHRHTEQSSLLLTLSCPHDAGNSWHVTIIALASGQPNDKVCYWLNIKNKVSVVFKQMRNKCTFHRYCLTVVYFIKKTRVQI